MNEVDGLRKMHKKIQSPFEHWIFSQLISFGKPLTDRHYTLCVSFSPLPIANRALPNRGHIFCLRAFITLNHCEFDSLTFCQ